ncbi:SMAP protein, partial [Polyodon spathula]|nr:SMAP protein [Polyodon spathula]
MGAGKKEHTGRIVIGDHKSTSHFRTGEENKRMNNELEVLYQQGLDSKLSGRDRRHCGLGFSEPEQTPSMAEADPEKQDSPKDSTNKPESKQETSSKQQEPSQQQHQADCPDSQHKDKKSSFKTAFVKSL